MAEKIRISYSGSNVDISPLVSAGYEEAEDRVRSSMKALDGTHHVYEWSSKKRYTIPVNAISSADYALVLSWWQNIRSITYYPDYDAAPGTSITARVINETNPLAPMEGKWDTYAGVIVVREV